MMIQYRHVIESAKRTSLDDKFEFRDRQFYRVLEIMFSRDHLEYDQIKKILSCNVAYLKDIRRNWADGGAKVSSHFHPSLSSGSLNRPYVRIYNADIPDCPYLCPLDEFDLIHAQIPGYWIPKFRNGHIEIGPKEFLAEGFWDKIFDEMDPLAISALRRIAQPTSLISLSKEFVYRINAVNWAEAQFLIDQGWMRLAQAVDVAIINIQRSIYQETELLLAGIAYKDIDEIKVMVEKLCKTSPPPNRDLLAKILITWAYENYTCLYDMLEFLEDLYLRLDFPACIEQIWSQQGDLLRNIREFVENHCYHKTNQ